MTAYAIQAGALRENPNSGPDGVGVQADIAYTLEARAEVQAVCGIAAPKPRHANDNTPTTGQPLRFLSVCSGIEAASVAWHPLGWRAVAFSEIEKFPSAVLAHHYPDVPNLGDFTKIDTTKLGQVDILAGGTPCQAFSVAGLRQGLDDARGNLTLKFVELAHELADGNGLRNVVWENVVGVLSDRGNAFGCFLAGLVGADAPIVPPGRWTNAGMVSGPRGRAAWRVLDAQYFGVAQRRRRVIVVADFGNGADPAAVLLIEQGLPRHPPARGEAGKDVAAFSASSIGSYREADVSGAVRAAGGDNGGGSENLAVYAPEIARCVATREGSSQDYESTTMVAVGVTGTTSHALTAEGADASEDGTGRGTPVVCVHADAVGRTGDALTPSIDAAGVSRIRPPGIGVIDDGTSYNLMASGQPHAICFTAKDYGADASSELAPTLRAGGFTGSHANGGVMPAVAFMTRGSNIDTNGEISGTLGTNSDRASGGAPMVAQTVAIRGRDGGATAELGGDVATALRASQGGGDKPHVLAEVRPINTQVWLRHQALGERTGLGIGGDGDPSFTLSKSHSHAIQVSSAVRRLTPMECERLQGFPDGYTAIPWRGKPADQCPDGPRYKALGNSWAVPKFTWLGRRIAQFMPQVAANDNHDSTPISANRSHA